MTNTTKSLFSQNKNGFTPVLIPKNNMLTVCSYHATCTFQSESTLYSCLNVKELLAQNRYDIWSLSDCNRTRTRNHLVYKQTLNHLGRLAKLLSFVVITYLYGAFDCMVLSCHIRISEWIHLLWLPECHGTPCLKQACYLKFKWLQRDLNWAVLWVLFCMMHLIVCPYHVMYAFQSESTLYSCLIVKELLTQNRHKVG